MHFDSVAPPASQPGLTVDRVPCLQALAQKRQAPGRPSQGAGPSRDGHRTVVMEVHDVAQPSSDALLRAPLAVEAQLPRSQPPPPDMDFLHPQFNDEIHGLLPAERNNSPDAVSALSPTAVLWFTTVLASSVGCSRQSGALPGTGPAL